MSLPRRESKAGRGHRGFVVTGDPDMSIEEAARRRDFTVNAISWDPLTGEYFDPFDGRGDLERRLLRVVDPQTFGDDSLRVLRAVQFAARFELHARRATRATLPRRSALDDLPAERVWGEIEKLLFAPRPSIGFALAMDLGVVAKLFPELQALAGCPQEPEWHPEGDVWVHTLQVIDQARTRIDDLPRPQQIAVMLGAVCHDLGKPATTGVHRRAHPIDGSRGAGRRAGGRVSRSPQRATRSTATTSASRCSASPRSTSSRDRGSRCATRSATARSAGWRTRSTSSCWRGVAKSDCEGREPGSFDCTAMDWFLERARALGVEHRPPAPILLGRHLLALGLKPGPRVGEILKAVYEQQMDGTVADARRSDRGGAALLNSIESAS